MKKKALVFGIILIFFSCSCVTAFSVVDTEGPTVTNYTITPETVDPGDYVTVQADISDISGVAEGVSVQICSSAGNVAGGNLVRISGDEFAGTYKGTYQIPTGYSAGQWRAVLYTDDELGNFGGFNTVYFTVTGVVDTEGPTVTNYTITPETVDPGDYVTVQADISDISGVAEGVSVQICSSAGNVAGGNLVRISGDEFAGTYKGTYQIPTGYSAGQWRAVLYTDDELGNFGGFNTVYFTVTGVVDTEGPTVTNYTITPEIVAPGDYVTVQADISDISGVAKGVSVQICSSAGNVAGGNLVRISGDEFAGTYKGTYQIPTGYSDGRWRAVLYTDDKLGNFGGFNTVYFSVYPISGLTIVVLPQMIKEIASKAFAGINTEVIVIPEGCLTIASDAFDECTNLKFIINHSEADILPIEGVIIIQ